MTGLPHVASSDRGRADLPVRRPRSPPPICPSYREFASDGEALESMLYRAATSPEARRPPAGRTRRSAGLRPGSFRFDSSDSPLSIPPSPFPPLHSPVSALPSPVPHIGPDAVSVRTPAQLINHKYTKHALQTANPRRLPRIPRRQESQCVLNGFWKGIFGRTKKRTKASSVFAMGIKRTISHHPLMPTSRILGKTMKNIL